jgi:hypothetical protein
MRARVVAPATMRCHDQVVCLVVSLCEDNANFCVKTMYCCVTTTYFLLIYVLCQNYMYCCINLLYELFWRVPIRGGSQNMSYIYTNTNIFLG